MKASFSVLLLLIFWFTSTVHAEFILSSPDRNAVVVTGPKESEPVRLAVADLISDVEKITGQKLAQRETIPTDSTPYVLIQTVPDGRWENYSLCTESDRRLVITGSDERGTMFGIYELLDTWLGVDPFYFWTDREPVRRSRLSFTKINVHNPGPMVKYRGWFINDEDLLTKWREGGGTRQLEYPFYSQVVHPEIMERITETLLRSRYNMIIPASFLDIMNPSEEKLVKIAAKRGLFISQHHIEPLGVSAFTFFNYWKKKNGTRPAFSWYGSRKELLEVWNVYAEKWSKYPNVIWQIGLRGIADRPMWMADPNIPQSDAQRGAIITDAMKTQAELVKKYDSRPHPPMTATLWMEGALMIEKGYVRPPKDSLLVFADNCPGWKMQNDFYSIPRGPDYRYGIYYHHQLWGSGPHLAQGISPQRTWLVLHEALEYPATDLIICNVSNIREFVLGIDATSKMLWNLADFNPDTYLTAMANRYFPSAANKIVALYHEYFNSYIVHPETKTPYLLDGLTRIAGRGMISVLKKELATLPKKKSGTFVPPEPVPFPLDQTTGPLRPKVSTRSNTEFSKEATKQKSEKKYDDKKENDRVVNVLMSDMHPRRLSFTENLYATRCQAERFDAVLRHANETVPSLTPSEAAFLRTNLIAPAMLMRSLNQWYEQLILARLAVKANDRRKAAEYLDAACSSIKETKKAEAILCPPGKWEFWYRGDDKMDLDALIKDTQSIKELNR